MIGRGLLCAYAFLAACCATLAVAHAGGAGRRPVPIAQVNYMLQCQGCHLADGMGREGKVPQLRGLVGRYLEVPGGREYLVRVPGSSQSPLDDAELAEVLNWVVEQFGPEEVARGFVRFTAEEVRRVRRPPLLHVSAVRAALLACMGRAPDDCHAARDGDR
jgi:mono/diheme cytochrome c family protein